MREAWNPWHGCIKYSEGCRNCYMYFLDRVHGQDGSRIYKVKGKFDYPIQRDKHECYKIESGEIVRTNMTSDFFLEEADQWRNEAWDIIAERSDLRFYIVTKRVHRVNECLPHDWRNGWENVELDVTVESQEYVKDRLDKLLELPFKHKGLMIAPMLGPIKIEKYLATGQIEQVICGGENYEGCRPCNYDWVKDLSEQCKKYNVTFVFFETGTRFIKNGKEYMIKYKKTQSQQASKSGLSFEGRKVSWKLTDTWGLPVPEEEWTLPKFTSVNCATCGNKPVCGGCTNCGKCEQVRDNSKAGG